MIILILCCVYFGASLLIAIYPALHWLQPVAVVSAIIAVYRMVEDVIKIIRVQHIPIQIIETAPKEPADRSDTRIGYVYLIQSPTGHYKIGHTSNPDKRIKTFESKLPFEIEFIHLICTEDRFALEKELHRKFAQQRVRGEWFKLTSADVDYIKSL